jgi:hypothetical protein
MKAISKILAFYFLLGSLFPGTDFSQWSKLYVLLEHFEEHGAEAAAQGEALSFPVFLLDHFLAADRHDHPDGSHQDLPLQSIQYFPLVLSESEPLLTALPVLPHAALFVAEECSLHSGYFGAVFRPPIFS